MIGGDYEEMKLRREVEGEKPKREEEHKWVVDSDLNDRRDPSPRPDLRMRKRTPTPDDQIARRGKSPNQIRDPNQ